MRVAFLCWALVLGLFGLPEVRAQRADEAKIEAAHKLISELKFQSGEISLGDNLATLHLPETLQYLSPADTRKVLVDLWSNPPSEKLTLGMIVPKGVDFLSGSSWVVVVTYDEDGHVKDNDAADIDYTKMLAEMKESVKEGNPKREKEGYPTVELIGWAAPPKYDAQEKKLYWAKELRFGGEQET
ncbi:MAG TPA: DUF2167 domain-containing protein, partial [Chthoniobacterales bacterium]|nr:DUF2167 domain-containing protein [Chthoniobacterales bacterium]